MSRNDLQTSRNNWQLVQKQKLVVTTGIQAEKQTKTITKRE